MLREDVQKRHHERIKFPTRRRSLRLCDVIGPRFDVAFKEGSNSVALLVQFGVEGTLEEAVDGEDARFARRMEEPHADHGADEVGPFVALGDGGVDGEGRVEFPRDGAQPGERDGVGVQECGDLEDGARGRIERREGGADGGGDFAELRHGAAGAGDVAAQGFEVVGYADGVPRLRDAGVVLAEIDGGGLDGERQSAEGADDFARSVFIRSGGEGGVGLVEADEVERVVFRELIEVDLDNVGASGGERVGKKARRDEEADTAFAGKEGELIGREKRGRIDVVEEEERGAARAQGVEDAAGREGVVELLVVGQFNAEVGDEGAQRAVEARAAFAADEPTSARKGVGLAKGEGERKGGLADATDADEGDGRGRRGVEQMLAEAAQFRFAPDEAIVRPAEIPALPAVEREEAEALRDVIGEAREFLAGGGVLQGFAPAFAPRVERNAEALAEFTFPLPEPLGVARCVEVRDLDEPKARRADTDLAAFEFALAPFLPLPSAGVADEIRGGKQDDEETRGAKRAVTADFPVVEVANVRAIVEDLDVPVEQALELAFELRVQGGDDFADVVAVRVGNEEVELVRGVALRGLGHAKDVARGETCESSGA